MFHKINLCCIFDDQCDCTINLCRTSNDNWSVALFSNTHTHPHSPTHTHTHTHHTHTNTSPINLCYYFYSFGSKPLCLFLLLSSVAKPFNGPEVRLNYDTCSRPEACAWFNNSVLLPQPLCRISVSLFHNAGIFDIPMEKSFIWIYVILGRKTVWFISMFLGQKSVPGPIILYYCHSRCAESRLVCSTTQGYLISRWKSPLLNFCNSGQLRDFS